MVQAVAILFGKMGRGLVEPETLAKVGQLVKSLEVSTQTMMMVMVMVVPRFADYVY